MAKKLLKVGTEVVLNTTPYPNEKLEVGTVVGHYLRTLVVDFPKGGREYLFMCQVRRHQS